MVWGGGMTCMTETRFEIIHSMLPPRRQHAHYCIFKSNQLESSWPLYKVQRCFRLSHYFSVSVSECASHIFGFRCANSERAAREVLSLWTSLRSPRADLSLHRDSAGRAGFQWLPMASNGFQWLPMVQEAHHLTEFWQML